MKMFFLGGYVVGAILTFLYIGFFCMLGGDSGDLWRPFFYALAWPIMLPLFVAGKAG